MADNYDYNTAAKAILRADEHFERALVCAERANENVGKIKLNWLRDAEIWLESAIENERYATRAVNR